MQIAAVADNYEILISPLPYPLPQGGEGMNKNLSSRACSEVYMEYAIYEIHPSLNPMELLPLSWSRSKITRPKYKTVELPLSGLSWVHTAEVPNDASFEEIYEGLLLKHGSECLIRGCGQEIARYLKDEGFDAVRTGLEGVIDLTAIKGFRPSVRELVRRGMRQGSVAEVELNNANRKKVSELSTRTAYGKKPRFNYLFLSEFERATRCFVFTAGRQDKWLGALTMSATSGSGVHTEMILRDKTAPPGVMEALFVGVMDTLKREGYEYFSLGEVPFVTDRESGSANISSTSRFKERVLLRSGRMLKFAFDYAGLFRFKDKFNPEWRPVYICAAPALTYSALADVFFVSKYFDLTRSQLASAIRDRAPSILKNLSNPFSARI
jgi:hypothetical protein